MNDQRKFFNFSLFFFQHRIYGFLNQGHHGYNGILGKVCHPSIYNILQVFYPFFFFSTFTRIYSTSLLENRDVIDAPIRFSEFGGIVFDIGITSSQVFALIIKNSACPITTISQIYHNNFLDEVSDRTISS